VWNREKKGGYDVVCSSRGRGKTPRNSRKKVKKRRARGARRGGQAGGWRRCGGWVPVGRQVWSTTKKSPIILEPEPKKPRQLGVKGGVTKLHATRKIMGGGLFWRQVVCCWPPTGQTQPAALSNSLLEDLTEDPQRLRYQRAKKN